MQQIHPSTLGLDETLRSRLLKRQSTIGSRNILCSMSVWFVPSPDPPSSPNPSPNHPHLAAAPATASAASVLPDRSPDLQYFSMTESYSEILYGPNRSYDSHFKGSFIFIRPI